MAKDHFYFLGFELSKKRQMLLEKLLSTVLNVFFMEAGHDIRRFVADDLCNSDLEECVNMVLCWQGRLDLLSSHSKHLKLVT